jgi:thymidylate kinase
MGEYITAAVEGLDGAGKSTFSKKLVSRLKARYTSTNIVYQHFPRYDTELGEEISRMLQIKEMSFDERLQLCELFAKDRAAWWEENEQKMRNSKRNTIVVFDRYRLSNILLNAPRMNNGRNTIQYAEQISEFDQQLGTKTEDLLFMMTANHKIRMERLAFKKTCDANEENDVMQVLVAAVYPQLVYHYRRKYMDDSDVHYYRGDWEIFAKEERAFYDELCIYDALEAIANVLDEHDIFDRRTYLNSLVTVDMSCEKLSRFNTENLIDCGIDFNFIRYYHSTEPEMQEKAKAMLKEYMER